MPWVGLRYSSLVCQSVVAVCVVFSDLNKISMQYQISNQTSNQTSKTRLPNQTSKTQIEATCLLNVNKLVLVIGLLVALVAQMLFLFRKWGMFVWRFLSDEELADSWLDERELTAMRGHLTFLFLSACGYVSLSC